jgi:hypothetical protein
MSRASDQLAYEYMLWRAGAFDKVKNKTMKKKVIQVCNSGCEQKHFTAKVGNKSTTFCCQKGFELSLKEFSKSVKQLSSRPPNSTNYSTPNIINNNNHDKEAEGGSKAEV